MPTNNPTRFMPLNPDGTLPMTATAVAGALESSITARWRAVHAHEFGDFQGHWMGGRCGSDTRIELLATLADVGVGDLHPGLHVDLDIDDDGRPTAFLVSNPRSSSEIPCRLSSRAFRINAVVVPLERQDAGRRVLEAVCAAIATIVSGSNSDRRKGRRHDA